jgi:hypothetical protein
MALYLQRHFFSDRGMMNSNLFGVTSEFGFLSVCFAPYNLVTSIGWISGDLKIV